SGPAQAATPAALSRNKLFNKNYASKLVPKSCSFRNKSAFIYPKLLFIHFLKQRKTDLLPVFQNSI
ncbi:MAG: hypothetical protein NXI00_20745, partial [Cytophagales bacterium]|nr:hypothetical protein [Cytophagales bacterium]